MNCWRKKKKGVKFAAFLSLIFVCLFLNFLQNGVVPAQAEGGGSGEPRPNGPAPDSTVVSDSTLSVVSSSSSSTSTTWSKLWLYMIYLLSL